MLHRFTLLALLLCSAYLSAQDAQVTFQVDMTGYSQPFTTAYVSGSFNEWFGDANPLTDDDGDGIWSATVPLPTGTYEYKFQLDQWAVQDMFDGSESCIISINNGEFINRIVTIEGDTTLAPACLSSCDACGGDGGGNAMVTFQVDLTDYTEPFTTAFVSGSFNEWSGGSNPLADDDGDGIWTGTVSLPAGTYEYKFQLDEWAVQDMFDGTESCIISINDGEFINRIVTIEADTTLAPACLNSCDACGVVNEDAMVTFQVDLSEYTEPFTTAYVSGSFNEWFGDANPLTDDDGDGIWSTTIPLPAGTYEYKFQLDQWAVQEMFDGTESCIISINDGEFVNRIVTIEDDVDLGAVCWNSCNACGVVVEDAMVTFQVDLSEYTEPFTTAYVSGSFNEWFGDANPLADDDGDGVYTTTIALPPGTYEYKFQLDQWAVQEMFDGTESCIISINDGEFVNRIVTIAADTTLANVCYNSCNSCATSTSELEDYGIAFSVRPTLVDDRLLADLNQPGNQRSELQIISADGRVLRTMFLNGTRTETLDVSGLASGTYFVRLRYENAVGVRRFIKR